MDGVLTVGHKKGSTECVMNFHVLWRQSWYMMEDRTLTIVKGPSHLSVNFRLTIEHFRFLASNQTLSPLVKGVNLQLLHEDIT